MRAELESRPLLIACAGLTLGLAAPIDWIVAPFVIALLALIRPWRLKRLAAIACGIGLVLAPRALPAPVLERRYFEGLVTVATVPRLFPDGSSCEVEAGPDRFSMWVTSDPGFALGDVMKVYGLVRPLPEGSEAYWRGRGVSGRLQPTRWETVHASGGLFAAGVRWRGAFVEFCGRTLGEEAARIVDAVCFNVDGALDPETRTDLQRSGTTHIVSASGLHVLIFALGLQFVLGTLPIPRGAQLVLLALVLVVYAGATGFRPPVVRAVLMATVYGCAYLARREPDALSALALAAGVYLVASPGSVRDIGFQLSFATVAGLALFLGRRPTPQGALSRGFAALTNVMRTSAAATVASAPLVAYHFGMVSVVSVVANVGIAFVLAPLMMGAMGALVIDAVLPSVAAGIMAGLVEPLAGWVLFVVEGMGRWSFSALEVQPFHPYWILAYYGVWLAVWRRMVRPAVEARA